MKIINIFFVVFLSLTIISCKQKETVKENTTISEFFNKGDRVVFVGNSITHMGMFHHNIFLYHVTRFPDKPLEMYNLGVSGDVTTGVLNRMQDDIMVYEPTQAVIMLGMNDVQRHLYGKENNSDEEILKQRKDAVDLYKKNLDSIINIFLSKEVKVILESPSIYDQTTDLPETNLFGVNDVLGECAVFIDSLSDKYKLPTVDYYTIMKRINTQVQKTDPSATLTCEDRIHPEETGHLIMAYQFLKTEKAPKYVSKIVVDSKKAKADPESQNCEINSVTRENNNLSFTVKENALPFPSTEEQKEGMDLVNFTNKLNVELLKITGLQEGQYQLNIDGEAISEFSGKQLNEGVNLAEKHNTPQFKQANKVLKKFQELWKLEGVLRGMKFIEYMDDYKTCPNKVNLGFVEKYLDSAFNRYPDPYYKNQLNIYISNKPKEEEMLKRSEQIRKEVYALAKTGKHNYTLHLK